MSAACLTQPTGDKALPQCGLRSAGCWRRCRWKTPFAVLQQRVLPAYTKTCWPPCWGMQRLGPKPSCPLGAWLWATLSCWPRAQHTLRHHESTHRGAMQHILHSWAAPVLHAWRRSMLLGCSPIFLFSLLPPVLFDSFLLWPVTRSLNRKKKKEKKKEKCCNNNNDDNNNNNSRCLHRWVSCAEQRTRGRPYLSLWRCASSF